MTPEWGENRETIEYSNGDVYGFHLCLFKRVGDPEN